MGLAGDTDAAGLGDGLQSGGHVDTFSMNIDAVIGNVAEVHPHAKIETAGPQTLLQGHSTAHGILNRGELSQKTRRPYA